MVLEPLNHNKTKKFNYLKSKYNEIFEFLKELGIGIEMTFDEFLEKFQIDRSSCIMCLQIQLKRPQVLLKRTQNF